MFIVGPVAQGQISGYHLLAVLLVFSALGLLFVVILDRHFEFENRGTDGASGGSIGAMSGRS